MKWPRWRLFPKYATAILALVTGLLAISGSISLAFSWSEIRTHLVAMQAEKAQGAATRIEQYVLDIEHQLGWTAFPRMDPAADAVEQRRIEYLKLLRQVPAVTELVWIGTDGRERLRVSRLAMDAVGAGTDWSREPAVAAVKGGKTYFGPVSFRKGTEPYMTIARPAGGDGGVTMADVNLKFVWDVVSRIKIGERGLAYVVDAGGTLIAHPDISLVLKKTDLRALPQVAALAKTDADVDARNLSGEEVFSAHARIPTLNWTVLVETPRAEAFAPLYESVLRLGLLLVAALLLATAASFFLARALVKPIRALQQGAARIGAGELGQRIEVKSGDELEGLAEQFNQMGTALQESYAGLERKVEARTRELSDALEQQTATAEVLQVISSSVADTAPVFDKILESCERLFDCWTLSVNLIGDDGKLHLAASRNAATEVKQMFPMPLGNTSTELAIRKREVLNYADVLYGEDVPEAVRAPARRFDVNYSQMQAPLLWHDRGIGSILLTRKALGGFTEKERGLLKTFADQAVIAIQNARLFNETRETLERQTATAEVLRVISSSVADTRPVFDAILQACERLFNGLHMGITLVGDDGAVHLAAHHGPAADREAFERSFPVPLSAESGSGAAIQALRVMHYPDVEHGADVPPYVRRSALPVNTRAVIFAPLVWEGRGLGSVFVGRREAGAFSDKEIELLRTFADQAVIAIQNARLFNETKEALEQQTATAEVLRVISNSVADAKPVFQKILQSCSHLFGGTQAAASSIVLLGDDDRYHIVDYLGPQREAMLAQFPRARADTPAAEMAIGGRRVLRIADVLHGPDTPEAIRAVSRRIGFENSAMVMAPLLWRDQGIGVISAMRSVAEPFTDKEVALMKTFADQAGIAIQNARLFHEIEDKSRQLEAANRHKSEFLANMSHELRTPLNAIIGFSEVLAEQMFGDVNDKQMEYLQDIHSSGQHLLSLINDVLDLSKIEAGKMELDLSCFDLGLLLEHSATLVRERAQRHGLTLELEIGEGLNEWVADARKVKQVAVNLLSNAVKFTPNGGRVTVRARHLNGVNGHAGPSTSQSWAEVSVSDTGVGIKPEDQALVFEEFRQASGDVLRKAEGTGLGLALVKRFVELHGGRVSLDSEPGRGSTFRFVLPQHEVKVLQ